MKAKSDVRRTLLDESKVPQGTLQLIEAEKQFTAMPKKSKVWLIEFYDEGGEKLWLKIAMFRDQGRRFFAQEVRKHMQGRVNIESLRN